MFVLYRVLFNHYDKMGNSADFNDYHYHQGQSSGLYKQPFYTLNSFHISLIAMLYTCDTCEPYKSP